MCAIVALVAVGCDILTPTPQIVVAGHANRKIYILDKESKQIVWSFDLEKDEQCNSIHLVDGDKNLLFSTQSGAKLVAIESKEVLWSYNVEEAGYKNAEAHHIYPLPEGGYALFVSGKPAYIIEFSKHRTPVKVVEFDAGSNNKHAQFRQSTMSKDGNWLLPLFPKKAVVRMSRDGEVLDTYTIGGTAFSVREAKDGTLLMGFGDSHKFLVYDPAAKKIAREITEFAGDPVTLLYTAQFEQIGDDQFMVANWSGHNKKKLDKPAPQIVEFNGAGEITWMWDNEAADLGKIAAFVYSKKALVKVGE